MMNLMFEPTAKSPSTFYLNFDSTAKSSSKICISLFVYTCKAEHTDEYNAMGCKDGAMTCSFSLQC